MGAEIERQLALQAVGSMVPFTVLDGPAGRVVGMTTYMHMDQVNRRVEIGSTWYARRVQRTGLNTEAELLLLAHAFDHLGCIAVEFRTHFLNFQSRRAIERLGAKLDGARYRPVALGASPAFALAPSACQSLKTRASSRALCVVCNAQKGCWGKSTSVQPSRKRMPLPTWPKPSHKQRMSSG